MRSLLVGIVVSLTAAVGLPAFAQAPPLIPLQGTLYDADGAPVNGVRAVEFSLYDAADGGSLLWSDTVPVTFTEGLFTSYLGTDTVLPTSIFAENSTVWAAVTLDGGDELGRFQVATSPFSGFADYCGLAAELDPFAISIIVDDTLTEAAGLFSELGHRTPWSTIDGIPAGFADGTDNVLTESEVDAYANNNGYLTSSSNLAWARLTGVPAGFADGTDNDSFAGISCPEGQTIVRNSGNWGCTTIGDITAVVAGTGLSGGATVGSATLNVNFAGTGSANTAARSDHEHFDLVRVIDGVAQPAETWNPTRYHYTVTSATAGRTFDIPQSVIIDLCGDADGCQVIMGMTRWDSTAKTETAARQFRFYYSPASGRWRASDTDTNDIDGDGGRTHVRDIYNHCYFTDGPYVNFASQGDPARGMHLLMTNEYNGTQRTCEITFMD
jgi:hypothetical protein